MRLPPVAFLKLSIDTCILAQGIIPVLKAKFCVKLRYTEGYWTEYMPFIAMLWNQPITSPKLGLRFDALGYLGVSGCPAADKARKNDSPRAAAAMPAATQVIAGALTDFPFSINVWIHAASSLESIDVNVIFTLPSKSGTV